MSDSCDLNAGIADFRRMDAVPGATLQVEELIRGRVIAEPLTAFTTGALGNARTHMMLWEQCSASDAMLTVAEDDAVFNRHFSTKRRKS